MNAATKTRVILADDHNLVRSGMAALLSQHGGFEVVAEATDGLAALEQLQQTPCDLLIVDLAMPRLGGIQLIEQLRRTKQPIKVLVLSMYDDAQFVSDNDLDVIFRARQGTEAAASTASTGTSASATAPALQY